jgi:AcrR family transcriptional regulator
VSFQQIAEKVGISQPGVYKHFEDKDDLMKACILKAAESGRTLIDQHVSAKLTARKKLFAYLEANLLWMQNHPSEGAVLLAMYYFALKSSPIHEIMTLINKQSVDRMSSLLVLGHDEKVWNLKDPLPIARAIHDLLLGEMIKAIHDPVEVSLEKRMKFLWKTVEKLVTVSTK